MCLVVCVEQQKNGVKAMGKNKKIFRRLIIAAILASPLLVLILYLTLTSSFFLKAVALPLAGNAMGAPLHAESIDLSLLSSRLQLKNFTAGQAKAPFLKGDNLSVSFALWEILSGNIKINSLTADNINIKISKGINGKLNAKPSQKPQKPKKSAAKSAPSKAQPVMLDIKDVKVNNLNFEYRIARKDKEDLTIKISDANIELPELKTGKDAELRIKGKLTAKDKDLQIESNDLSLLANAILNKNFEPEKCVLDFKINNINGTALNATLKQRKLELRIDTKLTDKINKINELSLKELTADGRTVSFLSVSGTISQAPLKLEMDVKLKKLSEELSFAIQEMLGEYRYGAPTLRVAAKISYANNNLTSSGKIHAENIKISNSSRKAPSTAPFDFALMHDLTINMAEEKADIKAFEAKIKINKRGAIKLKFDNPSSISWKDKKLTSTGATPKLSLIIADLPLVNANAFIPPESAFKINSGQLQVYLQAKVEEAGNVIELSGTLAANNLRIKGLGTGESESLEINKRIHLRLKNFAQLSFAPVSLILKDKSGEIAKISTFGAYNLKSHEGKAKLIISHLNSSFFKHLPKKIQKNRIVSGIYNSLSPFKLTLITESNLTLDKKAARMDSLNLALHEKKGKLLSFSITKPFPISWAETFDITKQSVAATLKLNRLDMKLANSFLAPDSNFKIDSGKIEAGFNISTKNQAIKLNGQAYASGLNFSVGKDKYKGILAKQYLDVKLDKEMTLTLKPAVTEISALKLPAIKITSSGKLKLKQNYGALKAKINFINQNTLKALPEELQKSIQITKANLTGDCAYSFGPPEKWKLQGKLHLAKLQTKASKINSPDSKLNGDIILNLDKTKEKLKLNEFQFQLKDNSKTHIADLSANADIALSGGKKSNASVISQEIKLKPIENFLMAKKEAKTEQMPAEIKKDAVITENFFTGTFKKTENTIGDLLSLASDKKQPKKQEKISEPPPMDLKWLNLALMLNLKNISYGKHIKSSLSAKTTVKNNIVKATPVKLLINSSPIDCAGAINLGKKNGYPYALKGNFRKLQTAPIFKALMNDSYNESRCEISEFSLTLKGKGSCIANLRKYLRGKIKIKLKDISLSSGLREFDLFKSLFLPIETLAKLQEIIPSMSLSQKQKEVVQKSKDILESATNMSFNSGDIELSADKQISIDKFMFTGDLIRKLQLNGNIGYDGELEIKSELNVSRIILPLNINGTMNFPLPDLRTLIPAFLKANAINVLNPENIEEAIKTIGNQFKKNEDGSGETEKDIDKTLKKTRKLLDLFINRDDNK